jgi:hypothetical protein
MITSKDIMSDADVAKLVNISTDRFQRRMRDGFKSGELDFSQARPTVMGGRRVWLRADVERIITERTVAK